MMLISGQDVDGKVAGVEEISKTGGLTRQAPQPQRGIERDGSEGIHGHAHRPAIFCRGGDHRHSSGELPESAAEIAAVDGDALHDAKKPAGETPGLFFRAPPYHAHHKTQMARS